jgi:predicted N-acyltransferase
MQSRDREEKPFNSFNNNVAPKMEDFASFEQYLDALVSHERLVFIYTCIYIPIDIYLCISIYVYIYQMEDFASFEQYLDALVSHKRYLYT